MRRAGRVLLAVAIGSITSLHFACDRADERPGFAFPRGFRIAHDPVGLLRIYLLAGQSNMEGRGYTHREADEWLESTGAAEATSLQFLLEDPDYLGTLPRGRYSFLRGFDSSWAAPRSDVWVRHVDSGTGHPDRRPENVARHRPRR